MQAPRSSTETDRRHLLADSAASLYTDGDRTPRARSPAPSTTTQSYIPSRHASIATEHPATESSASIQRPYRGFPSEEHYLEALREWAEEKKYLQTVENPGALKGFYGTKTMQDYKDQAGPGLELGWRKKWKAKRENKRRASTAG